MLSPYDWVLTVRVLCNLARMWPQLTDATAPFVPLAPVLSRFAVPGDFEVQSTDFDWGRASFAPKCPGPLPIIVLSSGAAADGSNYQLLVHHWASHGFCVLQPVHADSFNRHLGQVSWRLLAYQRAVWAVWALALGDEAPWRERVQDVRALLDRLPALEQQMGVALDAERIGVGGYSYGAHAALLLGGAQFVHRRRRLNWGDERVRAVLAISAEPGVRHIPRSAWTTLTTPFYVLTGERDGDILGRSWHPKAAPARYAPAPGELCVLPGATHFAFSGRLLDAATTEGQRLAQTALFDHVKATTLLFWQEKLRARSP